MRTTRHEWTADHCLGQLRALGVQVSATDAGKLRLVAPDGIDLRPMLRVLRKYRDGMLRTIKASQHRASVEQTVDEQRLLADAPAGMKATVNAIKAVFADVGGATVLEVKHADPDGSIAD